MNNLITINGVSYIRNEKEILNGLVHDKKLTN